MWFFVQTIIIIFFTVAPLLIPELHIPIYSMSMVSTYYSTGFHQFQAVFPNSQLFPNTQFVQNSVLFEQSVFFLSSQYFPNIPDRVSVSLSCLWIVTGFSIWLKHGFSPKPAWFTLCQHGLPSASMASPYLYHNVLPCSICTYRKVSGPVVLCIWACRRRQRMPSLPPQVHYILYDYI